MFFFKKTAQNPEISNYTELILGGYTVIYFIHLNQKKSFQTQLSQPNIL